MEKLSRQSKDLYFRYKRTVLIIEKEHRDRISLSYHLSNDYNIVVAETVKQGFAMLLEHANKITSVFIDSNILRMDVRRFVKLKTAEEQTRNIPVIMIIENPNVEKERACYDVGVDDFIVRPFTVDKLRRRAANSIRKYENEKLLDALEFDELTGLYTYNAFLDHVDTLLTHKDGSNYTMIVSNVDGMKLINERYGTERGDELLRYFGKVVNDNFLNGFSGRISGDRFCAFVYTRNLTNGNIAELIEYIQANAPIPNVVINCGIYKNVDKSLSASAMCDRARMALSIAEKDPNNSFAFYNVGLLSQKRYETELVESFSNAIQNEEFEVWYQPKVNPQNNYINGAEALVRWRRRGELIPPYKFIELFERTGDIVELDKYVFTKACREIKKLMEQGYDIPISVNLSRLSMYNEDLPKEYKLIADSYGVPLALVPIEITETATTDSEIVQKCAEELDNIGFAVSMDDFGTGSSTLASLDEIKFSRLKLDKKLIDKISAFKGEMLLKHVIQFCIELGIFIVAEGVETKEQVEFLKALNCCCIQGYYYSKPLPQNEFERFIRNKIVSI